MNCKNCDTSLSMEDKFCKKCGSKIITNNDNLDLIPKGNNEKVKRNFKTIFIIVNLILLWKIIGEYGLKPEGFGYGLGQLFIFDLFLIATKRTIFSTKQKLGYKIAILIFCALGMSAFISNIYNFHILITFIIFSILLLFFVFRNKYPVLKIERNIPQKLRELIVIIGPFILIILFIWYYVSSE